MINELYEIYESYIAQALASKKNVKGLSGILGIGLNPQKDHCHSDFLSKISQWTDRFLASDPSRELVYDVAEYMLKAADENRNTPSFWNLFAAQKLVMSMVPFLSPAQCHNLADWYQKTYSRREQLPAQRQLYKCLVEAADAVAP